MTNRTPTTTLADVPPNGREPPFTEDDRARAELGSTTDGSQRERDRMTPQRAKKTPLHDDPGHTA